MAWKIYKNIRTFVEKCRHDNISAFAAQAAFFIILSLIPFLMVFSSMLKYTPVSEGMIQELVKEIMPAYIAPFMISVIDEVYNKSMGIVSITAIIAVWSAAKGVQYMANGLNMVNGIKETRSWIVLRFWAVIYTIVFLVAIVAALVLLVFGNSLQEFLAGYFPLLSHAAELLLNLRSLIAVGILILFFTVVFRALPNNKEIRDRKLTLKNQLPGALICALAWYAFSFGVSVYVDYFNGFSMYGNLTTIVLVMLWLYFCMYIMMTCAEINVMYEKKFRRLYRKIGEKKG